MGAVVCSLIAKPGYVANATGLGSHGARRISTGWPGYIGYNGLKGRAARPGTDDALSEISAGVAAIVRSGETGFDRMPGAAARPAAGRRRK
jgi:hypothetical protein